MTGKLTNIDLDPPERALPAVIEQERRVAVFDLLEENHFEPIDAPDGDLSLKLGHTGSKLLFSVSVVDAAPVSEFSVSIGPMRQVVKDYRQICSNYYEAVRTQTPAQIEALDNARRSIHGEGAQMLTEALADRVAMDTATSRRLFTLVCSMLSLD